MPNRLLEALGRRGLRPDQMEVLRRHHQRLGGTVDTAVLELSLLGEPELLEALGAAYGLPTATASEVVRPPDPAAIRAFPEQWAKRHALAPMDFDPKNQRLTVLSGAPPNLALLTKLGESLELTLSAILAPEMRVHQRLALLYAHPPPARIAALLDRAGGAAAEAARPPRTGSGVLGEPQTFSETIQRLRAATQRDEIVHLALAHLRRDFDFVALFSVHEEHLSGFSARGAGSEYVQLVRVPRGARSALWAALDTGTHYLGPLDPDDLPIFRALRRPPPRAALCVPLKVRERGVAVLYAESGPRAIPPRLAANLLVFATHVEQALEAILRRQKGEPARAEPPRTDAIEAPVRAGSWSRPEVRPPPDPRPEARLVSEPPPGDEVDEMESAFRDLDAELRGAPAAGRAPPAPTRPEVVGAHLVSEPPGEEDWSAVAIAKAQLEAPSLDEPNGGVLFADRPFTVASDSTEAPLSALVGGEAVASQQALASEEVTGPLTPPTSEEVTGPLPASTEPAPGGAEPARPEESVSEASGAREETFRDRGLRGPEVSEASGAREDREVSASSEMSEEDPRDAAVRRELPALEAPDLPANPDDAWAASVTPLEVRPPAWASITPLEVPSPSSESSEASEENRRDRGRRGPEDNGGSEPALRMLTPRRVVPSEPSSPGTLGPTPTRPSPPSVTPHLEILGPAIQADEPGLAPPPLLADRPLDSGDDLHELVFPNAPRGSDSDPPDLLLARDAMRLDSAPVNPSGLSSEPPETTEVVHRVRAAAISAESADGGDLVRAIAGPELDTGGIAGRARRRDRSHRLPTSRLRPPRAEAAAGFVGEPPGTPAELSRDAWIRASAELVLAAPPPRPASPAGSTTPRKPRQVGELLDDLEGEDLAARAQAHAELLARGAGVLPDVMDRFPGRLAFDPFSRRTERLPPFPECGPLLALIVELGPQTHPYVAQFLDADRPLHRFFAVYYYSAVEVPDAVAMLGRRLHDEEARICLQAVETLSRYRGRAEFQAVLQHLHGRLEAMSLEARRHAVRMLTLLRDHALVPTLIEWVDKKEKRVLETATEALVELTRQDFGLNARRWRQWWEEHGHEPRPQWLLAGLGSEDEAIRRGASLELMQLTGQQFGYDETAPKKKREDAQRRWAEYLTRPPEP